MASSGNVSPGVGHGESSGARVSRRKRSTMEAAKTCSVSGEGESSDSRRSAGKSVKAAAAESSKETRLTVVPAKNNSELDADIWSQFHEDQQVKIIAKLPFKELFQAMSLSKTWRLRFHCDPIFRSDVRSSATSWQPYAPLYVNGKKGLLVGYQRSSQSWHQLQTQTYLPRGSSLQWYLRAIDGPLFCWVGEYRTRGNFPFPAPRVFFVANPLMKSWKRLPPQPDLTHIPHFVHAIRQANQAYKVLVCSTILAYNYNFESTKIDVDIQIFDSTNGSWKLESYSTEEEGNVELPGCHDGCSAVIEGVLYILFCSWKNDLNFMLISLDLMKKVFKGTILVQREWLGLLPPRLQHVGLFSQLVVCGSSLMLVVREPNIISGLHGDRNLCLRIRSNGTLTISRFDLERLTSIKVSQAPSLMLGFALGELLTVAACGGDVIYIGHHRPLLPTSLCYNVGTQQWYSFNSAPDIVVADGGEDTKWEWEWKSITYQPGLDPFHKV